jgi:Ca2+-binding EF-hand superfamily protein
MDSLRRLAFVSVLVCFGLPAAAQPGDADLDQLFKRLDRDGDGYLSREELESPLASQANWIAVDRDRDGRIARAEFGGIPVARSGAGAAAGGTFRDPQAPARR